MSRARIRPHRATLIFTGLAVAYLVWKIDIETDRRRPARDADPWWFALAVAIMIVHGRSRWRCGGSGCSPRSGSQDRLGWLTRAYFVSYTAGPDPAHVDRRRRDAHLRDLATPPGSHGGHHRRSCCSSAGSAARPPSLLGAIGFVLAIGRYDVGAYLWLEGAFVFGTIAARSSSSSPASARPLLGACVRCSRGSGSSARCAPFYEGVHHYRGHARLLARPVRLHHGDPGGADPRRSGRPARRSGSSSSRGSTT